MSTDVIFNGQATGDVASVLLANNFDVDALRPYIGADGRSYITKNGVAQPVANAATLRYDDWKMLDRAIIKAGRDEMRLVADIRGMGLQYVMPNGMGYTVLQTETQSDITPATVSMDGVRRGESDRPEFGLNFLPLPIIHKDFHFSARQIAASRNGGSPLDTTNGELAARQVMEKAEAYVAGVENTYGYGGGNIHGFVNFPQRLSKTMTTPDGTNNATILTEVLEMIEQARYAKHRGPYYLYVSTNWDPWMENDYSTQYPNLSLRQRLKNVDKIIDVRTADWLPTDTYTMVLVQMTSDVVRIVVGMELTTVQWESHGGMMRNFKVMTIMVPQLRADYNGNTGIVHGVAPVV